MLPRSVALALRREWLTRQVVMGRGHREVDIAILPRFVRPTDTCWDIGANVGTYTIALSRLSAHVRAFEPVPHNRQILEGVRKRAALDNVTIVAGAISDRGGVARMSIPTDGFYGGYYMATLDDGGELTVPVTTVDEQIAGGAAEPRFIKCDVEGAEVRVIEGARSLIARRHPIWLVETFEDVLIPLMESLGYITYRNVDGSGRLERTLKRTLERNYWFLPPDVSPDDGPS